MFTPATLTLMIVAVLAAIHAVYALAAALTVALR